MVETALPGGDARTRALRRKPDDQMLAALERQRGLTHDATGAAAVDGNTADRAQGPIPDSFEQAVLAEPVQIQFERENRGHGEHEVPVRGVRRSEEHTSEL